mgnify:CR=1 FL=1
MTDDKFFEELSSLINDAFDGVFGRKVSKPKVSKPAGKRFRMTKEQKNLGLTREEAFFLTYGDKK